MKLEELPIDADWDCWGQVFPGGCDYSGTNPVGPGAGDVEDVTAERIEAVLCWYAESPDGYGSVDFFAVVRLIDGQYAVSEAWADTTGWGCRADAWWKVGPTYDSVIAELSEVNRKRLHDGGDL